jgi:hypothetical protein
MDDLTIVSQTFESSSKITFKAQHITHKHIQSEEAYMSVVLRCGQNTRMSQSLYFVPQRS